MEDETQIHKISELIQEGILQDEELIKGNGPRLVVFHGPITGSKFGLTQEKTTVGRHPSSQIFLDDVTVSRHHAEIHQEAGAFVIIDQASLNGTYINKERIDKQTLKWGDEVQIGKFKFLYLEDEG